MAAASGIDAAEYAAAIDEILRSPQGSAFAKMMAEERLVRQEAMETAAEYEEMAQAESERAQAAEAEAQALKNDRPRDPLDATEKAPPSFVGSDAHSFKW